MSQYTRRKRKVPFRDILAITLFSLAAIYLLLLAFVLGQERQQRALDLEQQYNQEQIK